jgi:oligoendopeptidase F
MVEEAMDNFHRYFFIMPTLARFELEVFTRAEQGKPLTVKVLNQIMAEKFSEGYGDTMTDDPERTAITWATFLHLYMPFYTFQYAIGISAAHAIAAKVQAGAPGAAASYLDFLKAGGSRYTMDLFKLAGVDMASPEPVEKAFMELKINVDTLEKLT